MLKQMLRKLRSFLGYRRDFLVILMLLLKKRRGKLVLCDLDNTLIFTGQYCIDNNCNLDDAYDNAQINGGILGLLKSIVKSDTELLLLSARNHKLRERTRSKVAAVNLECPELYFREIILCPRMIDKLWIIYLLRMKFDSITVVDDLSGGHESGMIIWNASLFNQIDEIKNVSVYSLNNCNFFEIENG